MIKKIFYFAVFTLIICCSVKAFAFDLNENSPDFLNWLFYCQPYTEVTSMRFYNKMYTVKKQISGKDSDGNKCIYKETWTENNSNQPKTLTCKFTTNQILSMTAANPIYPRGVDYMTYPMSNDKKMMYIYANNPSVCKSSN